MPTKIPWTDESWPVVTGCYPCSTGCKNCYAARMAATRLRHHPRYEGLAVMYEGRPMWTGKVRLNHDVLEQPLHWRKPRMVFIASMGDLFHPDVPFTFIVRVFDIMYNAPQHTYQVLTKRPYRMKAFIKAHEAWYASPIPDNIWLGTSIENQAAADERIPLLLQTPAAVRFVSVEPMLEEVRLDDVRPGVSTRHECSIDALRVQHHLFVDDKWSRNKLDWVICGGESGPGARPMDPDWARSLRDQCQISNTPYFFKQWGRWLPLSQASQRLVDLYPAPKEFYDVGKKHAGCLLDGQVWDQFPVSMPG